MNVKSILTVLAALIAVNAAPQTGPKIAANDLKADVSFLASDTLQGRATPSPGLDVAAQYIAAEFRRAGLDPAGDDGYFQTAPYESLTPNLDGLKLTFESGGTAVEADKAALSLVEPVAVTLNRTDAVRIELVKPSAFDEMSPEQTRGKVLLVNLPGNSHAAYLSIRGMADAASKLKPALVIVLASGPLRTGPARARLRDASAPGSKVPILIVWDPAVRAALSGAPGRLTTVSALIPAPQVQIVKLRNVIAVLRGTDPILKDTYLLLSAHYDHLGVRGTGSGDHIYNGANDDASGTASVIEIAGALSRLAEKPRRSIVFMTFFGEEAGELGSHYYCRHPVFPLAETVADINLEQLGRTDDNQGRKLLQFNLTGFDFTNIASFFRKAGAETGIQVVKREPFSETYFGASDNAAFAEAEIPSTTISVSYAFPDYHQPGDEWTKLDYGNMAKVDDAILLGLLRMAASAEAPQWNKSNPDVARFIQAR